MRRNNLKKKMAVLTAVSVFLSGLTVAAADGSTAGICKNEASERAAVTESAPEYITEGTVKKLNAGNNELSIASSSRFTSSWEWEILKLTNKQRLANGLWPLSVNDPMFEAAAVRASELTAKFDHTRPNGSMPWTALGECGVGYQAAGENIAVGYGSPQAVVNAWMGSEGHRENILSDAFVHLGVGHNRGYYNGQIADYWAQLFLDSGCDPRLMDIVSDVDGATAYHVGTPIDDMPLVLMAECSTHGECYIPVTSEMCEGLDVNKLGMQELVIGYNGYGIKIPVIMHPFTDVGNVWYTDWVVESWQRGTMKGLTDTAFGPEQSLVRAQFAIMLYRMNGEPPVLYKNQFSDVKKGEWFADAVLWAYDAGVVTGYSNSKKFGPADAINREQMAVMMYRYANAMGYNTSVKADFSNFSDARNVNQYAREAMQWAVGNKIITGKDNGTRIDPQGYASRAECATIITRFQDLYQ